MGYRNYFYIAEKKKVEDFLKLSHEEQLKVTAESKIELYKDPEYAKECMEEYIERGELGTWEARAS